MLFTFVGTKLSLVQHRWHSVPMSVGTEGEEKNKAGGSGAGTPVPALVQAVRGPRLPGLVRARQQQTQTADVILIVALCLVNTLAESPSCSWILFRIENHYWKNQSLR